MAAEVFFRFDRPGGDNRIVVPAVAIGEDRSGRFVFLLEAQGEDVGVVRRRPVTVGRFIASGIEVLDGLAAGDLVVTAGVRRLSDGLAVKLLEGPGGTDEPG